MVELSEGVERVLENPTSGDDISVIVTVEEGGAEETISTIEASGGVVEMVISEEDLAVTIDERELANLVSLPNLSAVEIEGKGRVLESPDFRHPVG